MGAAFSNLGDERKDLDQQLKTATQELFGQPRDDAKAVTLLLQQRLQGGAGTAPQGDRVRSAGADLAQACRATTRSSWTSRELDIRPKKTFIKGTVDSAAAVDEIGASSRRSSATRTITKGAITEVSGGAKQFTLNIASKCP